MAFSDTDGIAILNWTAPATAGAVPTPGTNVALNANATTTLYTVPTGYKMMPFAIGVKAEANANSTDICAGGNSTSFNDFIPTTQLDNLDADEDMVILQPVPSTTPLKCKVYAAGTVFSVVVSNQAGGATNRFFLLGWLIPDTI